MSSCSSFESGSSMSWSSLLSGYSTSSTHSSSSQTTSSTHSSSSQTTSSTHASSSTSSTSTWSTSTSNSSDEEDDDEDDEDDDDDEERGDIYRKDEPEDDDDDNLTGALAVTYVPIEPRDIGYDQSWERDNTADIIAYLDVTVAKISKLKADLELMERETTQFGNTDLTAQARIDRERIDALDQLMGQIIHACAVQSGHFQKQVEVRLGMANVQVLDERTNTLCAYNARNNEMKVNVGLKRKRTENEDETMGGGNEAKRSRLCVQRPARKTRRAGSRLQVCNG